MTNESYTPKMLRDMFDTDNSGISTLCREARLVPKKDLYGNTYFTKHDVSTLKKLKELHNQNSKVVEELMASSKNLSLPEPKYTQLSINETFEKLNSQFESFQNAISEKISTLIDDKLDGMDEVVVELIRCKTENETLRFKLNELEKANYNLKTQLSAYKNVGFNFYVKKEL